MVSWRRVRTVIVVVKADVQATRVVIRPPANSQATQCAMTVTKDAAITASSPTTVLSVVLRPELAIPQRHALAIQVLVLRMQVHLMARVVATAFSVPAVNAQVVISSAGVLWVATKELETTLLLATVRRVRSAALVEDRTLCSETMSASRCNRTS
jgi:hypothetical protein